MALDEVHIVFAGLRKLIVFLDAPDVAFPARKGLIDRLCLLQERCYREVRGDLSVDLVAHAYLDLIQVAKGVQDRKGNLGGTLHAAAVLGSNGVVPAYTSGTSGGGTELALVAAPLTELVCFLAEDLGNEFSGAYGRGVGLCNCDDILDLIGRDTGAYGAVACQSGG